MANITADAPARTPATSQRFIDPSSQCLIDAIIAHPGSDSSAGLPSAAVVYSAPERSKSREILMKFWFAVATAAWLTSVAIGQAQAPVSRA
jgi:hypothetical protein